MLEKFYQSQLLDIKILFFKTRIANRIYSCICIYIYNKSLFQDVKT